MFLYSVNEEAFHLILSDKKIENHFFIQCHSIPSLFDDYSYAYFIEETVVLENKILEFMQEIVDLCLQDIRLLWVDIKDYDNDSASNIMESKKINVLTKDINVIKYILEYDVYNFDRKLEFVYE